MLDTRARRLLTPPLSAAGSWLAARGVRPTTITVWGFVVGVGACVAAAVALWPLALLLWLGNRLLDGLDGPVARASTPSDRGGFLDICADFTVYAGFVVGVAIAVPDARLACVVLLTTYYVSGTAFLALSSLAERRRAQLGDDRSLRFVGGLAEGTETVVAYAVLCLVPQWATAVVWAFSALVAVTAVQRVVAGCQLLSPAPTTAAELP